MTFKPKLRIFDLNEKNPLHLFKEWHSEQKQFAKLTNIRGLSPDFFTLSTTDENGISARTLLLREISEEGLIFNTNKNSRKGRLISHYPTCVCVFGWFTDSLIRQVRIKGTIKLLNEEKREEHFRKLPISWQIGYHTIEEQGLPFNSEEEEQQMIKQYYHNNQLHEGKVIPVPDNFIVCAIQAEEYEFYESGESLIFNERILFSMQSDGKWDISKITP